VKDEINTEDFIKIKIKIVTNTAKRGARLRCTDSPQGFTGQSYPTLTCTNFEGKIYHPPPARELRQRVTTGSLGSYVLTSITTIIRTPLITPYTSRLSV